MRIKPLLRLALVVTLAVVTSASRVVAVGDLHGDLAATLRVLRRASVVDANGQWAGGATTLVQLGDVLDRGIEEPEVWALLRGLRDDAAAAGGRVVSLLGNHEVLNVCGQAHNFIHPNAQTHFGPDRVAAFAPGGALARQLADCSVTAIIDDTVFVHGGIPVGSTRDSLEGLNKRAREWLLGAAAEPPPELLPHEGSPIWERAYSTPSDREPSAYRCAELRATLDALGVSRMVVGHTPQQRLNCACGGSVWRIDTGVSAFVMGGRAEALEIADGQVTVLSEEQRPPPLRDFF